MALKRVLALVAVGGVLCGAATLTGCKSGPSLSEEETKQIRQGPPPTMPPEGVEAMRRAGEGNSPAGPPRPAGQPGPGGPGAAPPGPGGQ